MPERGNICFTVMGKDNDTPKVYVIQEIAGTRDWKPKINIMGSAEYGDFKFLLPELSQINFTPGPLIYKLRQALKKFTEDDIQSVALEYITAEKDGLRSKMEAFTKERMINPETGESSMATYLNSSTNVYKFYTIWLF